MSDLTNAASARSRGRLLMLAGLGLALFGAAAYAILLSLGHLMLRWYTPV
jgi:hypothetical protein